MNDLYYSQPNLFFQALFESELDKLLGEPYPSCEFIQRGLSFNPDDVIQVCCSTFDPALNICQVTEPLDVIVQKINDKKEKTIADFKAGEIHTVCRGCPMLQTKKWGVRKKEIDVISLSHFMQCNLDCIHCNMDERRLMKDTDHERVGEIIDGLNKRGKLAKNLEIQVAGGEPSLSDGLLTLVQSLSENYPHIGISSNGAKYIEMIADGVNKGVIYLMITPDAGSREVFLSIKKKDNFRQTWRNIKKYTDSCGDKINIKFILQKENLADIGNMIAMCVEAGIKKIIISLDARIDSKNHSDYISHITYFRKLASKNGIYVSRDLTFVPESLWETLSITV